MDTQLENTPVILGKELKKLYTDAIQKNTPFSFKKIKFLLIRHTNEREPRLLLFEYLHPHEYHIEALIAYMKEVGVDSIWVNGGGNFTLNTLTDKIEFSGRSVSFDNMNKDVLERVAISYWPEYTLIFNLNSFMNLDNYNERLHNINDLELNRT